MWVGLTQPVEGTKNKNLLFPRHKAILSQAWNTEVLPELPTCQPNLQISDSRMQVQLLSELALSWPALWISLAIS